MRPSPNSAGGRPSPPLLLTSSGWVEEEAAARALLPWIHIASPLPFSSIRLREFGTHVGLAHASRTPRALKTWPCMREAPVRGRGRGVPAGRRKGEKGCGGRRLSRRAGRREGMRRLWCRAREKGEVWRQGLVRVCALVQQPRDKDWERSTRGDWAKVFSTPDQSTQLINTRREPTSHWTAKTDREVKLDLTTGKDRTHKNKNKKNPKIT